MFNETCGPGEVNDYDPVTGQFSALCVADTEAYRAAVGSPGGASGVVNVTPKPADAWTNYLIYGALALGVMMLVGGHRR